MEKNLRARAKALQKLTCSCFRMLRKKKEGVTVHSLSAYATNALNQCREHNATKDEICTAIARAYMLYGSYLVRQPRRGNGGRNIVCAKVDALSI